jgi:hypothetical protein
VWQASHGDPHTFKEIEVVTEATKKIREILAFGLLGVVAVLVANYFALLFKTEQGPFGKGKFSTMSALELGRFVSPVLVGLVVLAVVLVTHLGEVTKSARNITIAALVLLGVMILLGVVTWIAALTAKNLDFFMGDALGQGKVTGSIVQLAYLSLAGLAGFFTLTVLSALPAPVKRAAQPAGWTSYDPNQFGQAQPGQAPTWAASADQPQWGQPAAPQQWGQQGEQPQWGQPGEQPQWGQPGEPQWGQAPAQPQWGQPGEPPQWGQAPAQPQPPWGQPGEHQQAASPAEQQQWSSQAESAQEWSRGGQHADPGATQPWTTPEAPIDNEPAPPGAAQQNEDQGDPQPEPQGEEQPEADDQVASEDADDRKERDSPGWWTQPPQ